MAFPTTSAPFRTFFTESLQNSANAPYDLSGTGVQSFKGALYNNSVTGTKDDTSAQALYGGAGNWLAANEVSDTGGWVATGRTLTTPALSNPSSGVIKWAVANETSGTLTTGLTSFYGWMVYDDTLTSPADAGVCFNYFGGTNTAGAGATVTVTINANGLWQITI